MSAYALILAGGEGTRFAPLSTPERPKQFLPLVGDTSLIRQTVDRIQLLIPKSNCWVATNARYHDLVMENLPEIDPSHILGETHKKNTAPAIALAAACLARNNPDAVMVVLPSDHVILDEAKFIAVLGKAIQCAASCDNLITLGITPTWPSTEYGYIKQGECVEEGVFCVSQFVEKPNREVARHYLDTHQYVWNSGMFVWRVQSVLDEFRSCLPPLYELLQSLQWAGNVPSSREVERFFGSVDSVSIDYGVMEKSHRCLVIPAEFGWNDVGTWESLRQLVDSGKVRVGNDVRSHLQKQVHP